MMQALSVDPILLLVGSLVAMLLVCLAGLTWLRDSTSVPSHPVTRSVWCEKRQRRTTVEFVEEIKTGMRMRRVTFCPFKEAGGHCYDDCCFVPAHPPRPMHRFLQGGVGSV